MLALLHPPAQSLEATTRTGSPPDILALPRLQASSPSFWLVRTPHSPTVKNLGINLIEMNLSIYYDNEYNHHHSIPLGLTTSRGRLKCPLCRTNVPSIRNHIYLA